MLKKVCSKREFEKALWMYQLRKYTCFLICAVLCICFALFKKNKQKPGSINAIRVTIVSTALMDSPHLVSLFSLCLPLLSFHIITMYSLRGWLKGFSRGGEQRRENGGRWQQRRVVLITPCVWTPKGGVENLFQLINESPSLALCPSLRLFH